MDTKSLLEIGDHIEQDEEIATIETDKVLRVKANIKNLEWPSANNSLNLPRLMLLSMLLKLVLLRNF